MPGERANAQPGEPSLLPPAPHPSSACSSSVPHTQTRSHPRLLHSHTRTHARSHAPRTHSTLARALTPLSPGALAGAARRRSRTPLLGSLCSADRAGSGDGGGNRGDILTPGSRLETGRRRNLSAALSHELGSQHPPPAAHRLREPPGLGTAALPGQQLRLSPQSRFRDRSLETRSKDGTATAPKAHCGRAQPDEPGR